MTRHVRRLSLFPMLDHYPTPRLKEMRAPAALYKGGRALSTGPRLISLFFPFLNRLSWIPHCSLWHSPVLPSCLSSGPIPLNNRSIIQVHDHYRSLETSFKSREKRPGKLIKNGPRYTVCYSINKSFLLLTSYCRSMCSS